MNNLISESYKIWLHRVSYNFDGIVNIGSEQIWILRNKRLEI